VPALGAGAQLRDRAFVDAPGLGVREALQGEGVGDG
jgi:hypothetical protein